MAEYTATLKRGRRYLVSVSAQSPDEARVRIAKRLKKGKRFDLLDSWKADGELLLVNRWDNPRTRPIRKGK